MLQIPTLQELKEAKSAIEAKTAPLRAERDQVVAKLAPLLEKKRALTAQINELERPTLGELQTLLNPLERKEARRAKEAAKEAAQA